MRYWLTRATMPMPRLTAFRSLVRWRSFHPGAIVWCGEVMIVTCIRSAIWSSVFLIRSSNSEESQLVMKSWYVTTCRFSIWFVLISGSLDCQPPLKPAQPFLDLAGHLLHGGQEFLHGLLLAEHRGDPGQPDAGHDPAAFEHGHGQGVGDRPDTGQAQGVALLPDLPQHRLHGARLPCECVFRRVGKRQDVQQGAALLRRAEGQIGAPERAADQAQAH